MTKKIILGLFLASSIYYLTSPTSGLPKFPPNSYVSHEPADTESIYRVAHYTNMSRSEVVNYYKTKWAKPFIRLNHPPEFSFQFIRDQTRSGWLEELIHPGKDSIYINGYYPTSPQEQYNFDGVHYDGKISLHFFPSHPVVRLTSFVLTLIACYWLTREYAKTFA